MAEGPTIGLVETEAVSFTQTDGFNSLTCRITCTEAYFSITPCKGIWTPKSGNVLLVESGILGFGIRNTAQSIWNPTENWNPESNFTFQRLESSIWNPESTMWNAESKAVLDCPTLVNLAVMLSNMSFITWFVTCVRHKVLSLTLYVWTDILLFIYLFFNFLIFLFDWFYWYILVVNLIFFFHLLFTRLLTSVCLWGDQVGGANILLLPQLKVIAC